MVKQTKTQEAAPATKPAVETKPKKRNVKKIILSIIAAVVVLFIIIFVAANAATSAPAKVANSFLSYVQTQNGEAAYTLLSNEAKGAFEREEFVDAIKEIGPVLSGKPDMQSKAVQGETGSAATAEVVYLVQGSDSKTYEITINLIKEDGEWKVEEFNSEE